VSDKTPGAESAVGWSVNHVMGAEGPRLRLDFTDKVRHIEFTQEMSQNFFDHVREANAVVQGQAVVAMPKGKM
jgi:hypothetical protein